MSVEKCACVCVRLCVHSHHFHTQVIIESLDLSVCGLARKAGSELFT